jgi:hypothetical protein
MRNDVTLMWKDGETWRPSHFRMREFESDAGFVMVDSTALESLELVRRDLCMEFGVDVQLVITSGLRTEEDNARMAERLGWTEDGGLVARDSRHLPKYAGIAVDLYARRLYGNGYKLIPQDVVATACRRHFDYVNDNYSDGHVHADNRDKWEGK